MTQGDLHNAVMGSLRLYVSVNLVHYQAADIVTDIV